MQSGRADGTEQPRLFGGWARLVASGSFPGDAAGYQWALRCVRPMSALPPDCVAKLSLRRSVTRDSVARSGDSRGSGS